MVIVTMSLARKNRQICPREDRKFARSNWIILYLG